MMVIPPAIGVILILFGILLFIVDLSVTNHSLLTAGANGWFALGVLGSLRASKGRPALTGKEGMIGEVGTFRRPMEVSSAGWIFVHGELWRAVLAFAPEETTSRDREPVVGVGRKVSVVGFR